MFHTWKLERNILCDAERGYGEDSDDRAVGKGEGGGRHRCARIKVTLGHLLYVTRRVYTRVRVTCTHTRASLERIIHYHVHVMRRAFTVKIW